MTEFAFSGVGINPHYGTPGNSYDRRLIPGGSSSGAAVSVSDGGAVVAIGTDTGGSVRIPAALCGVVGFKPTQNRIPRDGVTPLSTTLDSIGPLANSVACCAVADAVMAGEPPIAPPPISVEALRLGVPQSYVLDDLASEVATAFADACSALSRSGARIIDLPLSELNDSAGVLAVDLDKGTRAFAGGISDPSERCFDQLTAGGAPIREIRGQIRDSWF
jgi:aspartyl-tRNA(Asn)/glutamyl-tRNA(Gln) amidotransferase subunit A